MIRDESEWAIWDFIAWPKMLYLLRFLHYNEIIPSYEPTLYFFQFLLK